ncbi:hypothetical protein SAMN06272781_0770 [Streptomyces sp. 1222.2]|uniref:hypothetical protein n=1 Tax=Streptomyces TaxID=1883 RepID=UPI000BCC95BA|nr:hypothetical protein [Streptomyces sp. 1222.2]SOD66819.1 hypothetical protein SAMN06272781_0770 [Streptomyces sp. 1222.2]
MKPLDEHPRTSTRPPRAGLRPLRPVRGALLAASLALLVTACGGGGGEAADGATADGGPSKPTAMSGAPAAGVVAPAKVEVIAELTGCEPKIRIDADELRQGVCHTTAVDYLVTTFPEERYKETWLESAAIYGGTYLVGPRWVVSAKPELLEGLRDKLGGTVRELSGLGPAPAPSTS